MKTEHVQQILQRLNRVANNTNVQHRQRTDIQEAMRIISEMANTIDELTVIANHFQTVEEIFAQSPELQIALATINTVDT